MCGTFAVRCWKTRRSKHDGQDHYLAEGDSSRVLVALDFKAALQNVSRRSILYSIEQTDADLAAVFSKWYTGTTEHRMHNDSACTKISVNSGGGSGMPSLSACGFSAGVVPVLWSSSCGHLHAVRSQAPSFLPTWMTGICGSNQIWKASTADSRHYHSKPPDQSTSLHSPPRHSVASLLPGPQST